MASNYQLCGAVVLSSHLESLISVIGFEFYCSFCAFRSHLNQNTATFFGKHSLILVSRLCDCSVALYRAARGEGGGGSGGEHKVSRNKTPSSLVGTRKERGEENGETYLCSMYLFSGLPLARLLEANLMCAISMHTRSLNG